MHKSRVQSYSLWLEADDELGEVTGVLYGIDKSGQRFWLADKHFAPYQEWPDVAAWVWQKLTMAEGYAPE